MRRTHSYSKRETLETCSRRYFYEYYASNKHVCFDENKKEKIRKLKNLSNCYLLAGDILHRLISLYFKKGMDWGQQWFVNNASQWFDKELVYSRNPADNAYRLEEKYPPKMLLEFYYQNPIAEEMIDRARKRLLYAIQNFFQYEGVVILRESLLEKDVRVEEKITGLRLNNYGIDGRLDLVAIDEISREVWIIDWKMGLPEAEQDSLQLFTYGWWASEKLSVEPTKVRVQRAFLGAPKIEKERFLDETLLRRGKARLIQDIELMQELACYGKSGNEKAFSQCKREKVCAQCKYQEVCL